MRHLEIIAHTGCEETTHNSLESCYAGYRAGAGILEVDVRETRDHVAILQHDDDHRLHEMTYAEILSAGWQLERLDTVLNVFKEVPVSFNLDLKTAKAGDAAMSAIAATGTWDQALFTGATLQVEQSPYAHHVMWNLPNFGLDMPEEQYRDEICEWVGRASRSGFRGINANYESCRPYLVEQAHASGLKVWIYTLPSHNDLFLSYARMGVDGISTYEVADYSERVRSWFNLPFSREGGEG